MTATFITADVFDGLAKLPDDSVDLVLTSPPFLALRSYLPADHPDKAKEIGSEATPADFLDNLLDVVEACDRVLAPHGSLVFELGDTFAGSGGAGGDYGDGGLRDGQERFNGAAAKSRAHATKTRWKSRAAAWSYTDAHWLAALIDAEGSIAVQVDRRDANPRYTPIVQVGMNARAMLERALRITATGAIKDGDGHSRWQIIGQDARYVLLHIWPYLMVKQPQAKAAIELARHVEDRACGRGNPVTSDDLAYREQIRRFIMNLNEKGGNRGKYPNDWVPPDPPRLRLGHDAGTGWPLDKSLAGIPTLFAWSLAYGRNLLRPERTTEPWRIRNLIVWARPNPPVGALGDKFRTATSYLTVACKSRKRWFDLDAVRTPHIDPDGSGGQHRRASYPGGGGDAVDRERSPQNPAGAPPLDYWVIPTEPYKGSHYATWPSDLCTIPIEAMCPRRVCRVCGEPSRRIAETTNAIGEAVGRRVWRNGTEGIGAGHVGDITKSSSSAPTAERQTLGWTDCSHNDWRNGVVLDPFAGSGTTLAVAVGHGRDAIGIDLDSRNADLARERVGMFLEVL